MGAAVPSGLGGMCSDPCNVPNLNCTALAPAPRSRYRRYPGRSGCQDGGVAVQRILDLIKAEQDALESERLFRFLADESVDPASRLSFTPAMLYYLMGFKDVLAALSRRNPETRLDRYINAYCVEDGDHWRWYLTDMEKLGYGPGTYGTDLSTICNEIWSTRTEVNRTTVFRLVEYARQSQNPLQALIVISVFEATGVVFIGHTRKAAIALGWDEELEYFGRKHYEEEFGHSVQAKDLVNYRLSDEEYESSQQMVKTLFADYRRLFDCWHDHVGQYKASTRHAVLQRGV